MESILRYIGNMSSISIREYVDDNITLYVEPFAGGFGCGFKLMEQGYLGKSVLNDKNYFVYNFWRCIKDDYTQVIKNINKLLSEISIYKYDDIMEKYKQSTDKYMQAAYEFVYAKRMNPFNNTINSLNTVVNEASFIDSSIRLIDTDIENIDYKDIILKYDSDNTLFMMDPPYNVSNVNRYYGNGNYGFDHDELRNIVSSIKGKWVVRYNDNEVTNSLYSDTQTLFCTTKKMFGKMYKEIYYSNIDCC